MTSDAELAHLCADAYLPGTTVAIGDDLAANVTRKDGETIVAFRGTANPKGWLRDLDALPKSHPALGYCHHGFLNGAIKLLQAVDLSSDKGSITLTGHSLGGALAIIFGALRIIGNQRVDRLATFGAPRAGYATLVGIWAPLRNAGLVHQWRNGNDPVTEVPPLAVEPIAGLVLAQAAYEAIMLMFPYRHVGDLIRIGTPDRLAPWNCHFIRHYATAVADLRPQPER